MIGARVLRNKTELDPTNRMSYNHYDFWKEPCKGQKYKDFK